jgi:hypothetical protein
MLDHSRIPSDRRGLAVFSALSTAGARAARDRARFRAIRGRLGALSAARTSAGTSSGRP